jgi:hypothetical protein
MALGQRTCALGFITADPIKRDEASAAKNVAKSRLKTTMLQLRDNAAWPAKNKAVKAGFGQDANQTH